MNAAKWEQHLNDRIAELEDDLRRTRRRLKDQRVRAAFWKRRALQRRR